MRHPINVNINVLVKHCVFHYSHVSGCCVMISVADLGFPQGGANSPGGHQHTILPNFPENCMKSKEFGCPGGVCPSCPLRSATGYLSIWLIYTSKNIKFLFTQNWKSLAVDNRMCYWVMMN